MSEIEQNGAKTPTRGSGMSENSEENPTPQRMGLGNRRDGADRVSIHTSPRVIHPTSQLGGDVTSPVQAPPISEIDLSSPLNYGTPSSIASIRTPRSGIRGTPIRQRPDVRTDRHLRQVAVGDSDLDPIPEASSEGGASASGNLLVIWGTNVVVNECKSKFKRFIMRYIDLDVDNDEISEGINLNEPLYMQKLEEIHTLEEPFMNINCEHLKTFDAALYRQLICYPQEVIPTFDMAVNEMFFEKYPAATLEHQIQVKIILKNTLKFRRLFFFEKI